MGTSLDTSAGFKLHAGKTRNQTSQALRESFSWSPVGIEASVQSLSVGRLVEERRFWNAVTSVPDLQMCGATLSRCVADRASITIHEACHWARRKDAPDHGGTVGATRTCMFPQLTRELEVGAARFPFHQGAQFAVDHLGQTVPLSMEPR